MNPYLDGFTLAQNQNYAQIEAKEQKWRLAQEAARLRLLDESEMDLFVCEHWTELGPLVIRALCSLMGSGAYDFVELGQKLVDLAAAED